MFFCRANYFPVGLLFALSVDHPQKKFVVDRFRIIFFLSKGDDKEKQKPTRKYILYRMGNDKKTELTPTGEQLFFLSTLARQKIKIFHIDSPPTGEFKQTDRK